MKIPALTFDEGGWCEEIQQSYRPGTYTPATKEEFEALAPFARKPVASMELEEADTAREVLVARAIELKIDSPSTLRRWKTERLQAAISEAESKLETERLQAAGEPSEEAEA